MLLVRISIFSYGKLWGTDSSSENQEQVFYSENGEPFNGQPVSFALTNPQPATPYPGPRFLQLTTCILELATVLFGERRTVQRPTSFFCSYEPATPDPGLFYNSQLATVLFGERRTVQRSTSFFCSYEPATPDRGCPLGEGKVVGDQRVTSSLSVRNLDKQFQ